MQAERPTQLQLRVAELAAKHGSLRAASRVLGVDAGYLSRLHSGQKTNPDKAVLRKLGLREVVTYERIDTGVPRRPQDDEAFLCEDQS